MTESGRLIQKAERADHIFRVLGVVLGVLTIILLTFLTVQAIQTNQQLRSQVAAYQEQSKQESAHTQQIIEQVKAQNERQMSYMRCLAQAVSTGGAIEDLDACSITEQGTTFAQAVSNASLPSQTTTTPSAPQTPVTTAHNAGSATPIIVSPTPTPAPKPTSPTPVSSIIKLINGLLQ